MSAAGTADARALLKLAQLKKIRESRSAATARTEAQDTPLSTWRRHRPALTLAAESGPNRGQDLAALLLVF